MRISRRLTAALADRLMRASDRRAPDFIVGGADHPYMLRWWMIRRNRFFNVYLHLFLRSDDDRALHDHPWPNVSFLLDGKYTEHTIAAGGVGYHQIYRAGELRFRRAKVAHRVELPMAADGHSTRETPCWSLFITGPVVREWGFHCPAGWRHWKDFVSERDAGPVGRGCA